MHTCTCTKNAVCYVTHLGSIVSALHVHVHVSALEHDRQKLHVHVYVHCTLAARCTVWHARERFG